VARSRRADGTTAHRASLMASHGTVDAPSSAPPPAILIVDDDVAKRVSIRAILAPLGHTVIEAESGRAALRAVLRQSFAIILMDVRMPTLDGYETARLIRQRSQTRLTPIIFVTASVKEHPMATATAYASGAVDFIFTPLIPDVLRAKVSTFVDLFVQSRQLQRSLESITILNRALHDSEARAQAVLQNVAEAIVTADEWGLIESFNRSARRLFGYSEAEVIGQPLGLIIAPGQQDEISDPTRSTPSLLTGEDAALEPIETVGRRRDGSCFPIEMETSQMQIGERTLTIGCIRDISERKAYIEALGHQALHDALTGLPNRTLFADRMNQAIASAERAGEPRGVLVMDLNGFKRVNDTLGHDRGDTLLREVSKRLGAALRETDTVARLGGDEFAILLDGASDLEAAATAAWKIQQACEPGFVINDEVVRVAPSIGIALFPEHGATTADLLRRADLAMYDAKRSGASHAVFDAAQEKQMAHSLALLADLRECVARQELVVHYQPLIDLATRKTTGVEALVRWRHPNQGLLQPGSFLPQAERTAMIAPLTRWVLNHALRQQQTWRDEGIDLTMAVNISARTLKPTGDLPDTVAELTEIWGTAPDCLTLELTESALIEAAAPDVLARLHNMGGKVSIDDFGTGYSSLAYLQNLPVDQLKIDQSFVINLATVPGDAVIVRSTIDLAHNLGLTVVAEGVEDENTLDILAQYGCDSVQGYFFSPALTAEELTAWLNESPFGVHAGGHH
jgi:diguanylate cyclase (GGDEF)-like protein/PAS domain S-box-containing protein